MYKIMVVKQRKSNYRTLYQFLTTDKSGEVKPVEIDGVDALDEKVESMLNDEGYAKSDFIIVSEVNYEIDAKNYTGGGIDEKPIVIKTLRFDSVIKLSDKLKYESENADIIIEAEEITDDLIYDSEGKILFDSAGGLVLDSADEAYTLTAAAAEIDEFIDYVKESVENNG